MTGNAGLILEIGAYNPNNFFSDKCDKAQLKIYDNPGKSDQANLAKIPFQAGWLQNLYEQRLNSLIKQTVQAKDFSDETIDEKIHEKRNAIEKHKLFVDILGKLTELPLTNFNSEYLASASTMFTLEAKLGTQYVNMLNFQITEFTDNQVEVIANFNCIIQCLNDLSQNITKFLEYVSKENYSSNSSSFCYNPC